MMPLFEYSKLPLSFTTNEYLCVVLFLEHICIIVEQLLYNIVLIMLLVVWSFDETCCSNSGVPEQCMGLCREVEGREEIWPTDQCEEHRDTIIECMYNNVGKYLFNL